MNGLYVFIGGGIGSVCRWLITQKIPHHYGTFCANVIGAFLIGILYEYFRQKTTLPNELRLLLMTGLLGGWTTFSTYLLDFVILFEQNKTLEAFLYLFLSVLIGILFLILGTKIYHCF